MAEVSPPIAEQVMSSVVALLQSVAEFDGGKAFHVLSEADLNDKLEGVPLPAVGVLYEGLRGKDSSGSHRTGQTAELSISILLMMPPEYPGAPISNSVTLRLLDKVRNLLKDSRSPSGHFWRFIVEAAAVERDGKVVWVQRWATPVQLARTSD